MVLLLALLDTQEEQEKFREIYENYRAFYVVHCPAET